MYKFVSTLPDICLALSGREKHSSKAFTFRTYYWVYKQAVEKQIFENIVLNADYLYCFPISELIFLYIVHDSDFVTNQYKILQNLK